MDVRHTFALGGSPHEGPFRDRWPSAVSTKVMPTPRPPKSDRDIQIEVLAELNRDGRLTPAEVGVEVTGGVVTLTGTVSRLEKIDAASDVAVSMPGVRDVANELTVEGESREHDDAKISHAIRHALGWNTAVPADRLDTIVRHGAVTLRGSVEHGYQREAAERTVAGVDGVVSVCDQIQVLAAPTNHGLLRDEVEDSLATEMQT